MNEVVPVKMRAGLVDIHAVFLILGYTVQGWVGFGFFFWNNGRFRTHIHLHVIILTLDRRPEHLETASCLTMCLASPPSRWTILDSRKSSVAHHERPHRRSADHSRSTAQ
jgi:hypothetical protein